MAYVGAPYNFSSLPEKTIERKKEEIPALDRFEAGLKSGEIHYTITTMTDTMIGDHTGQNFYKNIDGKYAVKASTARGLVRSNMQILSLSSIYDDISGDFSMMYRKVGSAASELKSTYETILGVGTYRATKEEGGGTVSIRKNVKAGFLYHDKDGKYFIYPSSGKQLDKTNKGEQNYYILRENQIIGALQRPKDKYRYQYLTTSGMNVLMYNHKGDYPFRRRGDVDRNAFNPHFRPSAKPVDFHVGMHEKIDEVAAPDTKTGDGWYHGYIVSSGYMNKKKAHYIVEGDSSLIGNEKTGIPVPAESIRAYEADYEARKNLFGTTQSMRGLSYEEKDSVKAASRAFYKIPAKGEFKPVFYIEEHVNGHMYFGFTPNLRLYYNHTIEEGVSEAHKTTINDYTRTILGYSLDPASAKGRETGSRKGRVSFSDAVVVNDAETGSPQNLVLGGPKPTSYYDYLEQEKNRVVTYNDEGIRIRGYKQYWLHQEAKDASVDVLKNAKVAAPFIPLKAGAKFKGIIRFNNLSDDELGLLLWSIRLEKNCEHNIGKAKAYGYGRVKIDIDNLRLFDLEKLYGFDVLDFNPYDDYSMDKVDEFIQIYKDKVSKILKSDIMEVRSIAEFLLMKDAGSFVPEGDIRYMDLAHDYRDRENEKNISKRGLPHPDDVKKNIPDYLQPAFKAVTYRPATRAVKVNPVKNNGSSSPSQKSVSPSQKVVPPSRRAASQPQKAASPALGEGAVVEGIVNGYYPKGAAEKHGVFLTLPGLKRGLLHENNASRKPDEYTGREKVKVKIIEYGENGKRIGLTDKDVE